MFLEEQEPLRLCVSAATRLDLYPGWADHQALAQARGEGRVSRKHR